MSGINGVQDLKSPLQIESHKLQSQIGAGRSPICDLQFSIFNLKWFFDSNFVLSFVNLRETPGKCPMSAERCVAFMADLESRDLKRVQNWFAERGTLWMPPTAPIEGSRRIAAMFRVILSMYSDIHWKVTDVYPIGPHRFVFATDSWGTIGADQPYKNHVLSIIEFDENNQIKYLSDYFKDTAIFKAGRKE